MKEQIMSCVLPKLPIVGYLRLASRDGKSLLSIDVVKRPKVMPKLDPFYQKCFEEFYAYLTGAKKDLKIQIDSEGLGTFQLKVLSEMKKIPFGKVATYKDLALALNSKGYQAIGSACGRNPFLLIYPCHRIVGLKDLGGFAHGRKMKKELLILEGAVEKITSSRINR